MPPNTTDTMHTPKIKSALELMRTSINGRLDGYQHEGVRWMLFRELESEVPSGILADDMGTGLRPRATRVLRTRVVGCGFWGALAD
jgi:SNF2 family DNA or RNA helicase